MLSGAEKRLLGISGALSGSELLDAVRDWESIAMLERTWGLEVDPFLDHEPYTSRWRKIRGNASRLIAKALECDAQAGTLRQIEPDGSFEAEDWICDR